jgi:hypothetical protein
MVLIIYKEHWGGTVTGWSSYDNLFGVLMITVTEFLKNVTDFRGKLFYILAELPLKMVIFTFKIGSLRCLIKL